MRLYNKTFSLTAEFVHEQNDAEVQVLNQQVELLHVGHTSLALDVQLPDKIVFRLRNAAGSLLKRVQVIGITIDSKSLLNIVEYKTSKHNVNTREELETLPTTRTLQWNQDGYLILNLFHPNPCALHLFIGNQIKFET